jgi:hypothetical protein
MLYYYEVWIMHENKSLLASVSIPYQHGLFMTVELDRYEESSSANSISTTYIIENYEYLYWPQFLYLINMVYS